MRLDLANPSRQLFKCRCFPVPEGFPIREDDRAFEFQVRAGKISELRNHPIQGCAMFGEKVSAPGQCGISPCGLLAAEMPAGKSWYKMDTTDIPVYDREGPRPVAPLSDYSKVVRNLGKNDQVLLYCRPEDREEAIRKVKEALNGME